MRFFKNYFGVSLASYHLVSAVLDEKSVTLLRDIRRLFHGTGSDSQTCHHITLWHKSNGIPLETDFTPTVGNPVTFSVIGMVADDRVQAMLVRHESDAYQAGSNTPKKHLHCTMSLADGVNPVDSNRLIATNPHIETNGANWHTLTGIVVAE